MNRRHLLPLLLAAATLGCESPSDEEVLRRTFAVPRVARLVSLEASPKTSGTFGREGLSIDAVFGFGPDELAAYRVRLEKDPTWRPLPPPAELLERLPKGLKLPQGARNGVWACRTAGDDLMHARKSDCIGRAGVLKDAMFAVLDTDRRTLHVAVHTVY
jgi:hypothetical protein